MQEHVSGSQFKPPVLLQLLVLQHSYDLRFGLLTSQPVAQATSEAEEQQRLAVFPPGVLRHWAVGQQTLSSGVPLQQLVEPEGQVKSGALQEERHVLVLLSQKGVEQQVWLQLRLFGARHAWHWVEELQM